jgi:BioD-like phosphotransacetylase family protein
MPLIYVATTGNHAGASLITWALAKRLTEKGLKVGFIKPFGTRPAQESGLFTDHDALLFKQVLRLPEPLIQICPFPQPEQLWGQFDPEKILADIKALALTLLLKYDVLLVMGSRHIFFDEAVYPIPDSAFISALNADLILIDRFQKISNSIYSILSVTSLLKEKIKGVIINRVTFNALADVKEKLFSNLKTKGVPISALIPDDPYLSFRTLGEIKEVLAAEFLTGEQNLGQTVGGLTVGIADLKEELLLFNRVYNKIILLKPSKPGTESQEPLKPRPLVGILLTNGRRPADPLLKAAEHSGLPVLLVKEDAFQVMERLESHPPRLSPNDDAKVRYMTGFLDRDNALEELIKNLL